MCICIKINRNFIVLRTKEKITTHWAIKSWLPHLTSVLQSKFTEHCSCATVIYLDRGSPNNDPQAGYGPRSLLTRPADNLLSMETIFFILFHLDLECVGQRRKYRGCGGVAPPTDKKTQFARPLRLFAGEKHQRNVPCAFSVLILALTNFPSVYRHETFL